MENELSHIDGKGQPGMVDVSKKKETFRTNLVQDEKRGAGRDS